jgi:hypothetical protein
MGRTLKSFFAGFGVSRRPPVRRPLFPLFPVAAALLVAWLPARAEPDGGRILSPGGGEALVAGQLLDVRWSSLPDDVEEMELLLSIDGGRSFVLRLTPQIDPRTGSLGWVVPRVAAAAARLRIRFGRHGEEIEGEPSAPFSIAVPPLLHQAPFLRRDGEWWIAPDGYSILPVPEVSRNGSFEPGTDPAVQAVLASSSVRPHTQTSSCLPAAANRRTDDGARDFGPPSRAAPPGITPRRE